VPGKAPSSFWQSELNPLPCDLIFSITTEKGSPHLGAAPPHQQAPWSIASGQSAQIQCPFCHQSCISNSNPLTIRVCIS
jgi:hypothetical protein